MKKIFFKLCSFLLVVTMAMTAFPTSFVRAETNEVIIVDSGECGEDLVWQLDNSGVLSIIGTGAMTNYSTSNLSPWYAYVENITSINFDEKITTIGDYAFYNCSNLSEQLVFPKELDSIGSNAFRGCAKLSGGLIFPDGLTTIGTAAFYDCTNLSGALQLNENLKYIYQYAFYNCSGLTGDLQLPNTLVTIDNSAFYNCSNLTGDLIIPENITEISSRVFYNCSGFSGNLILPSNLSSIKTHAFYGCTGLSGNLSLPDSLTSIGTMGFYKCSNLTGNLILPDNLEEIGNFAFAYCNGFVGDLIIPEKITEINEYAFAECGGFSGELLLPEGLTIIKKSGFQNCSSLTGILKVPEAVACIESAAFKGCSCINKIIISNNTCNIFDSTTTIAPEMIINGYANSTSYSYALQYNRLFECIEHAWNEDFTVDNNATCKEDGEKSIHCSICDKIKEGSAESIPASNHSWDAGIISKNETCVAEGIKTYTCTACLATKEETILATGHEWEIEYTIDKAASCIEEGAKSIHCTKCDETKNVTIIDKIDHTYDEGIVTKEPTYTTEGTKVYTCSICSETKEEDIPVLENTVIGNGKCGTNLTWEFTEDGTLTISGSGSMYDYGSYTNAYGGEFWTQADWGTYRNEIKRLVFVGNVSSIGANAFRGCKYITGEFELPTSVVKVGDYAFSNTGYVGILVIPNTVVQWGDYAFSECAGFNGIELPQGMTEVPQGLVCGCENITGELILPDTLKRIEWQAFEDCAFVGELVLPEGLEYVNGFSGCTGFTGGLNLPSSIKEIGSGAFDGCTGFTGELVLPKGLEYVDGFSKCNFTGDLIIPNGVKSISSFAFWWSDFNGKIVLPETVEQIGQSAFYLCDNLKEIHILNPNCEIYNSSMTIPSQAVIKGIGNSTAKAYADKYNREYVCLEHTYGNWMVSKNSTCTNTGSKYKECSACGDVITETIPATGHEWNAEYTIDKEATCLEDGSKSIHCKNCTITKNNITISKIDHTYGEWIVDARLSCTVGISKYKECSTCGDTITEIIPATDHIYGEWITDKEATCTESGSKYRACDVCFDRMAETIPATGHNWNLEYTIDKEATCKEDGSKSVHCKNCAEIKNVTIISKVNHTYGEWIVDSEASCTNTGSKHKECSVCGDKVTESIDKTEHTIVIDKSVEPTKAKYGLTEGSHCSKCNTVITKQEIIPALCESVKTLEEYKAELIVIEQLVSLSKEIVAFELENEIQDLEEQLEDYQDSTYDEIADLENSLGSLKYYSKDELEAKVSEYAQEVSRLQKIIAALSGDTSQETKAKVQRYKAELSTAQSNFNKYRNALSIREEIELLELTLRDTENWINREIQKREDVLKSQDKLTDLAYELINGSENDFYKRSIICHGLYSENHIKKIYINGISKIVLYGNDAKSVISGLEEKIYFHEELGHTWDKGVVTTKPTPSKPGVKTFTCFVCKITKTENIQYESVNVSRVYGGNRFKTSYAIADELKSELGVAQFSTVIVADGMNYPDALAGSYLAAKKNAPILMVNTDSATSIKDLQSYIKENVDPNGTIYILGGTAAVSDDVKKGLIGYSFVRLSGKNRYETNIKILEEAGIENEDILVCTGTGFADSLSGSATGLPILLVGDSITEAQEIFLNSVKGNKFYIIGGTAAVNGNIESEIGKYGETERISGKSRFETSKALAEKFFPSAENVVIAYAHNFPDGLCGGPLAYNMKSPLLLTGADMSKKPNAVSEATAAKVAISYVKDNYIKDGVVLGGSGVLSDNTARLVFEMDATEMIVNKKFD